ncbi:glycerate dehydrogenase [Phyllobacterium trifolii]|uniref:Glycerate dehydrogenase n=1 Tax=Phyllobacterium trifolii TaxID=300193 RepID=A0A839UBQ5_9HYPH|nr:glycerate dehydrogenase [Phyllobacterium trifolii]
MDERTRLRTPEKIVFLDRASLQAKVRKPEFPHHWQDYETTDPADIVLRAHNATIIITNKIPLTRTTLSQLPHLKFVAVAATGTDIVDIEACSQMGISVSNVRGYANHSLPEHVFAMILALRRSLNFHRDAIEKGEWTRSKFFCHFSHSMQELAGSNLGLIGYGTLGRSVAALGRAFKMNVLAFDASPFHDNDVAKTSFNGILEKSDVISLHVPLTPSTRNMIGAKELKRMKRNALLINTARGELIDENALSAALQEGIIAGAGIDVLSMEPPPADNALLQLELFNLILTPHVAWASDEAMQALADQLIDNIEAAVSGTPTNLVTPKSTTGGTLTRSTRRRSIGGEL